MHRADSHNAPHRMFSPFPNNSTDAPPLSHRHTVAKLHAKPLGDFHFTAKPYCQLYAYPHGNAQTHPEAHRPPQALSHGNPHTPSHPNA